MKAKKMMITALTAMLLGSIFSYPVMAAEEIPKVTGGHVDILINEDLGLIIETRSSPAVAIETDYSHVFHDVRALPEKENTKQFVHTINDRNGIEMAKVYATVHGLYSEVDSWAKILDISAYATGTYASNFSYSTSKNGADGYLYLYFNGLSAGTLHYKIYRNGTIVNL